MTQQTHLSWQGPGAGMTEAQQKAAWTVIEAQGGSAAFDLVVLTGSLPVGLGHGYSDVDLFVIAANGEPVSEKVRFLDGVPVQLNNVRREDLDLIANTFSRYSVVPDDRSQLMALRPWAKMATRLAFGTVLHATAGCAEILRRCDPEVLRRLTITEAARMASRLVEDTAGALLTGDPLIALHGSAEALRHAGEGILAACGDVFVSDSGLWRRLARLPALADVVAQLWGLARGGPAWEESWPQVQAQVRQAVGAATHLVSQAQLDGWQAPMTRCRHPLPARGSGAFYRNPFFQVLRFGDTIAIVGPDKAFRCNEATARKWLDADVRLTDIPAAGIEQFHSMGLLVPSENISPERR